MPLEAFKRNGPKSHKNVPRNRLEIPVDFFVLARDGTLDVGDYTLYTVGEIVVVQKEPCRLPNDEE